MTGIPSWARKGAKVVYLGRAAPVASPRHHPLSKGSVYTVRSALLHPETGSVGLLLDEVRNMLHPRLRLELGYSVKRFRPLVTRTQEQDISEHFSGFLHETRRAPERVG